ncbi:chorismate-binding protein [Rathayibacter oskolensis]|nr:chorismate-binding protein [Rathayibacter oskolensis]WKK71608.1 chorismate-binding protein [Rathayibacter oskolensis]
MTIRTVVLDAERARIGTGGGITALSVPAEEVEETRLKARALLAVLGVATEAAEDSSPGR